MAAVDLYSRAVTEAHAAVELDNAGDLPAALAAYARALALIDQGAALDPDAEQRQAVLRERQRYEVRSSLLRNLVDKQPPATATATATAGAECAVSATGCTVPVPAGGARRDEAAGAAEAALAAAAARAAATAARVREQSAAPAPAPAPAPAAPEQPPPPPATLVAVVHSLREQGQAMLLELQAAQDEACARLEAEVRCRAEAQQARLEAEALREEARRLRSELEESERGRQGALLSTSGANAM